MVHVFEFSQIIHASIGRAWNFFSDPRNLARITHVEPGKFFADEQRIGPYRIWHHEHHFKELDSGRVEMTDRVTYVLPLWPFGELVHPFLVRPQLGKIFAFREKVVRELFR